MTYTKRQKGKKKEFHKHFVYFYTPLKKIPLKNGT